MRLKAASNIDQVLSDLDRFAEDVQSRALSRTLNTLISQAETAATREIRDLYGISTRDIAPYFTVELAGVGRAEARIIAKGKGFPLRLFKPRQTKTGVTVTIKGRTITVPHAFLASIRGAEAQVFARGRYDPGSAQAARRVRGRRKAGLPAPVGGSVFRPSGDRFGKFAFGLGRFPISLLRSTSPPDALINDRVVQAMNDRVEEQAPKVLQREIRAAVRGF